MFRGILIKTNIESGTIVLDNSEKVSVTEKSLGFLKILKKQAKIKTN